MDRRNFFVCFNEAERKILEENTFINGMTVGMVIIAMRIAVEQQLSSLPHMEAISSPFHRVSKPTHPKAPVFVALCHPPNLASSTDAVAAAMSTSMKS